MKIDYFVDTAGLEKLLADYVDVFEMIDDYGQQLIQDILSSGEDYKVCLDKFTGAYITLEPLYTMAVAYKENEEIKAYVSMKRELEARGEKVVAASLEKEASASIEIQRRVRNVLEGYVEACAKAIGTCQTQLKRLELEYRNKN
jgi:uncharacterized iron-regulated protein